jgi:hypothetical protein
MQGYESFSHTIDNFVSDILFFTPSMGTAAGVSFAGGFSDSQLLKLERKDNQ